MKVMIAAGDRAAGAGRQARGAPARAGGVVEVLRAAPPRRHPWPLAEASLTPRPAAARPARPSRVGTMPGRLPPRRVRRDARWVPVGGSLLASWQDLRGVAGNPGRFARRPR